MKESKRYVLPIGFSEGRAKQPNTSVAVFTARYLRYRLDRAATRGEFFVKLWLTELYFAGAKAKLFFNYGVIRLGTLLFGAIE